MKNKKLKLEHLKVQSFVTSMEKTQKQTIEGGATLICPSITFLISASINIASKVVDSYNTWAEEELGSGGCYDPTPAPDYSLNCDTSYWCMGGF